MQAIKGNEMNKNARKIVSAALSGIALTSYNVAFAEEITVDAVAHIEKAEGQEIPIEAKVENALSFGSIKTPNGRFPGATCFYRLTAFQYPHFSSIWERDADGNTTNTGGITPSGCDWSVKTGDPSSTQLGTLVIGCDPLREVSVSYSYQNSAGIDDFGFSSPPSSILGVIDPENPDEFVEVISERSLSTECFEQGDGLGTIKLQFGGQIFAREAAEIPEGDLSVGSIAVDISY